MKTNSLLCIDLKTNLQNDVLLKPGKTYHGILKRDVKSEDFRYDELYVFTETLPWSSKRNPRLFDGRYISVTRNRDGSLRLNFKHFETGAGFNVGRYALWVYNEICMALEGLVEER